MLKRSCFLFFAALGSAICQAQIINAGFELPAVANGGFIDATGWTSNGGGGVWNIFPGYGFFDAEAPEGSQIGFSNSSAMAQQTGYAIKVGSNRIQVLGARRDNDFAGSFAFQLWAGGTVANGTVSGGTMLGSSNYNHTTAAPFSFTPMEVTYTASPGDPHIGSLMSVRFLKTAGQQMNYDEVKIGSPVAPVVPSGLTQELGTPFGGGLSDVQASDDSHYFVLNDENEPTARVRFDFGGLALNPTYMTVTAEAAATRNDLSVFIQVGNQVSSTYAQFVLGNSTLTDTVYTYRSATNVHQVVSALGVARFKLVWIPNEDLVAEDGWSELVDHFQVEYYYH